jgi:hypothetical protein
MEEAMDQQAAALKACLISPNEADRNCEPANIVDSLFAIARAVERLASAVEHVADDVYNCSLEDKS